MFNSPARNQFLFRGVVQREDRWFNFLFFHQFAREAVAVKAPVRKAGQARSTRAPGTNCDRGRVAQACDCGSLHESSILSGHPIHFVLLGGRSAARTRAFEVCYGSSSLPLPTKLSAQAGDVCLKPRPGRSAAGRNSLKVDVDGSSPSPATRFSRGRRSNGSGYPATNRETWRFKSSRPYHFRLVVQWRGRSPPKAEIPVRPRTGRPMFFRSVDRLAEPPAVYRV